jgi:hypothetical protein
MLGKQSTQFIQFSIGYASQLQTTDHRTAVFEGGHLHSYLQMILTLHAIGAFYLLTVTLSDKLKSPARVWLVIIKTSFVAQKFYYLILVT